MNRAHPPFALVLSCLSLLACDGGGGPTLSPIGPQSVRVNEELRISIGIDNPEGRTVTLTVADPMLPAFDRVHSITTSPDGAQFRWVPLSSHTGTHELTFSLTDGGGTVYDTETALVQVLASEDAAPVFVRPGAGGTYDLERDPCVTFDIEVRDDDSATVEIGARTDLPDRATLINAGAKRATFDWCPTPDQAGAAERWTIQLFADDGEHPRVEHDYVVVLRTGPKEGCPGNPPVITVVGPVADQRVISGTTYNVEVTVSDDMGLRDAPLLYWSTTAPEDPEKPDVTLFEQVSFEPADGETYVARIPSLGLGEGETERVYYVVSATDNDDPAGSICDHRTDTATISFFAEGGVPPDGSLAACDYCSASTECESGICAATASGGRCAEGCSDTDCSAGVCGATVTTEGGTRAGCGPVREICGGGGGTCTDDGREPDDSVSEATPYSSPITDGQICANDDDYFAISVGSGHAVTATVDGFTHLAGDLDLELRAMDGTILGTSASVRDVETVSYCNAGSATTLYARVFGFGGSENAYDFEAVVAPDPGGCCTDDAGEDDDTRATARTVTFDPDGSGGADAIVEGQICPGDDDWIAIPMAGPGTISVEVEFTHAMGDIDVALHDPSGVRIAAGVSVTDNETISADVAGGGTYALRIYGFSRGNAWTALISTSAGGGSCGSTADCAALGTVCLDGSCVADACVSSFECPPMHTCQFMGPPPAGSECALECTTNTQCRSGEACKWAEAGRSCGQTGSGGNGASCADYTNCGGQRSCVDWPGGYCARQGCSSNSDCESETRCVSVGGRNVCALRCTTVSCRETEGYACRILPNMGDIDRYVCVPAS